MLAHDPSYLVPEIDSVLHHVVDVDWALLQFLLETVVDYLTVICYGLRCDFVVPCDHFHLNTCSITLLNGFLDLLPQDVLDPEYGEEGQVLLLDLIDSLVVLEREVLLPIQILVGETDGSQGLFGEQVDVPLDQFPDLVGERDDIVVEP